MKQLFFLNKRHLLIFLLFGLNFLSFSQTRFPKYGLHQDTIKVDDLLIINYPLSCTPGRMTSTCAKELLDFLIKNKNYKFEIKLHYQQYDGKMLLNQKATDIQKARLIQLIESLNQDIEFTVLSLGSSEPLAIESDISWRLNTRIEILIMERVE